jgi:hypothetical protein
MPGHFTAIACSECRGEPVEWYMGKKTNESAADGEHDNEDARGKAK